MQVHRPTLVLMAGLPGAGKTTLAYALGHALGWQVIDKDTYREVLVKQGFDDDHAGKVAYELSFAHARTLLTRHRISAILDTAALHHFILDNVLEILDGTDSMLLKVILCVADRDLRNYRLRNRLYQPTSIRVDPATIPDYLRYFEHLPKSKLILSTNISLVECIDQAKKYIEIER
jgi:broad-specificity NMP kinase